MGDGTWRWGQIAQEAAFDALRQRRPVSAVVRAISAVEPVPGLTVDYTPPRRRPKREDITPLMLCSAVVHPEGLQVLRAAGFPPKVVLAAVDRDTSRGLISWGVSPGRPWLERRGIALLEAAVAAQVDDVVYENASMDV